MTERKDREERRRELLPEERPHEVEKRDHMAARAELLKPDDVERVEHNLRETKVRRIIEFPKNFYRTPNRK